MKRLVNTTSTNTSPRKGRAGTTLVELLISILLMGIGLATLMVLYPAAIFRTVRANQLTNGTILRYNAETQIDLHPFDTVFNDHFNLSPGFNPRLTTDDAPEFLVLDPHGYVTAHDDPSATIQAFAPAFGHDDADAATGIRRIPFFLAALGAIPADTFSALDECVDLDRNGTIDANDAISRVFLRNMVTLPDNWEELAVATVSGTFPLSPPLGVPHDQYDFIDIEPEIDAASINDIVSSNNASIKVRVVLFDSVGRGGHVRELTGAEDLTAPDRTRLYWREDVSTAVGALPDVEVTGDNDFADRLLLPNTFSPLSARIEVSSTKFTWLMTLRREGLADPLADPLTETFSTQNQADVVVFFNRSLDFEEEHIHDSVGLPASAIRRGEPEVFLSDDGNLTNPPSEGNFIFDVENCRWYKIVRVDEADGYYNLTIDRNAVANSENIMLIRNVVDVYPLDPFTTSIPPGP